MKPAPYSNVRWIFRAGSKGGFTEVQSLDEAIAFSFRDLSDLALLPDSRAAFRSVVADGYPDLRASQLPLRISQIYWFVHRIRLGDKLLLIDESRELACEGTVAGAYCYKPDQDPYFNQRAMQWATPRSFRDIPPDLVELWRGQTGIIPVGSLSRFRGIDTTSESSVLRSLGACLTTA